MVLAKDYIWIDYPWIESTISVGAKYVHGITPSEMMLLERSYHTRRLPDFWDYTRVYNRTSQLYIFISGENMKTI